MNARVVDLVAGGDRDRWALAGDQLYVDFDLRAENLPPGTRLQVGSATLEVSDVPAHGVREVHGAIRLGRDALHQREAAIESCGFAA